MSNTIVGTRVHSDYIENIVNGSISDYAVFPAFCDVHVHFREPGFEYKETIKTGSMAAAHGGYGAVCTMPNLNPVPDSLEHLKIEEDIIKKDAVVNVYPYAAITVGEKGEQLSDIEGLASHVIAFSDDGHGIQSEDMMREAMKKAHSLNKMIVAHCEVNSLLHGGYIHDGKYAKEHNHKGICSASEYEQVARDVRLAQETGCAYHVCHVSTKESVEYIRQAKAAGADVTCETAPHYLVLDENDLQEYGRFKMNPPVRSKEDRLALIKGIQDGTIDMIATDHAPHSEEEKSRGLEGSPFGVTGLEVAFPLLYTKLVRTGIITLERLIELISLNPAKRFGISLDNCYTVWDLKSENTVYSKNFLSKGKSTPFLGESLYGKCKFTIVNGKVVYSGK